MKRTRPCEAARAHLEAGRPIYYCEDAYPDEMIREWPDGRRELVTVTVNGEVWKVQPYPEAVSASHQG